VAFVAVAATSAVVAHVYAWRTLQGSKAPSRDLLRPMLAYGAPTVASALPQWLNVRLDQLVLIAMLAPESVGLYAVAVAWGGAAQPIATVLAFTAVPRLAAASDAPNRARQVYRSGVFVSAVTSVLLFAATPLLFPLIFGEEFRRAIPAALIMVIARAVASVNAVGGECLRGLGRPRAVFLAECTGLVFTGVAVAVLIPTWGIVGAALASLASYAAILVVQYRLISTTGRVVRSTDAGMVLAIEAPPR
jgi:O-antigen/teichoic acid export membrane protein